MAKKIPDISYWQGAINWTTAPADTDYVIIRASCGTAVDTYFSRNASGAAQNGIPYGVYHFLMCTSTSAAKKEAEIFYNAVKGQKVQPTIWVLDVEHPTMIWDNPATYHLNPALLAIVRAFVKRLRELAGDIRVWFYGGESVYKYAGLDKIGFDGLWIANYSKKPGMPCELWQYTGSGKWNGKKPVDLSKFVNATLDTLTGAEATTPAPAPVDENGDGKVVEITEGNSWNIRQFPSAKSASTGLYAGRGIKYEWAATAWNGWLGIYLPDGNIGWISGKAGKVVDA